MSSISQPGSYDNELLPNQLIQRIKKYTEGFFVKKVINRNAKMYHGDFCYDLVPNTAIKNFHNTIPVTSIEAGDCYIGIFENPQYQGFYQVIGPGEKIQVDNCGSIVVSLETFSIDTVQNSSQPPQGCWELSGPMYLCYFSPGYKFV